MINAAVVGFGNIGRYAVEAILEASDFNLAGVVRRSQSTHQMPPEFEGIKVTDRIETLGKVDVALLCVPTRSVPEIAEKYLSLGINTVDSYDIHGSIYDLKIRLDKVAKDHHAVSVISAGWDPGSDSMVRALMEACAPKGITYTNFGPGMSMGHTVAAKETPGVKSALSMTIPLGTSIHRRMVYVQLEEGASLENVASVIKSDPYFVHDETHVIAVDNIEELMDQGHGVNMVRKGVSGYSHNQLFEFNMKINNPALTSQIMVNCARASLKRDPGAYTMIEIPVIDMLEGEREALIRKLV